MNMEKYLRAVRRRLNMPKTIKDKYVTIFKTYWNVRFSIFPKKLPNTIAAPWLNKEPKPTPKIIVFAFSLEEKDKTNNCVLSPSSDTKIKRNEIIKG